jgi:DNA-binding transcriptional regulator/RsmH inhibitor MraZ
MGEIYTFHETAMGHLHILNQIPCEDASVSFSSEDKPYYIAIVADGHGSKACFRSKLGSKTAVAVAMNCLQQFAETNLRTPATAEQFYQDMSSPQYSKKAIRMLTNAILGEWHDLVMKDYKDHPPTPEEMGSYAAEYEKGEHLTHIYGTTLIAALQLPKYLILIHQGDGRCDVFYKDGTVDQPIPWDPRCEDTSTTSLCDEDAAEGFRHCVIPLEQKPVMACYLGSDGVEDAYRDTYESLGGSHTLMGGVHTFYKDLTCQISELGSEVFEDQLKAFLPEFSDEGKFSRGGSGDDVSVAGIVDLDAIADYVDRFKDEIKLYDLEEKLSWKEAELGSKTRKHGILKKRVEDLVDESNQIKETLSNIKISLEKLKSQKDACQEAIDDQEQGIEEVKQELLEAEEKAQRKVRFPSFKNNLKDTSKRLSIFLGEKKSELEELQETFKQVEEKISVAETNENTEKAKQRALFQKYAEANLAFKDYDAKYQAIEAERQGIEDEIRALKKESAYLN